MTSPSLILAFYPASNGGLSYRGTEVNMYDLAYYNQITLHNKSIICLKKDAHNEPLVLKKFQDTFDVFVYFTDTQDLETQLLSLNVHGFYSIRYGKIEEPMLKTIPMLIHNVYDMSTPHGLIMAGVSKSVADKYNKKEYVPHMVSLYDTQEHYRKELNIPEDAIVLGRHGGEDTWDLEFVKDVVVNILESKEKWCENIYFLFAVRPNLLKDINHPRLICLKTFADLKVKRKFINTCNAMLHAQSLGETFGLSCAEMSQAGKIIIVWNGGVAKEHLRILGDKCLKYNNKDELWDILKKYRENMDKYINMDWVAYNDYTPDKIIHIFNDVFLNKLRSHLNQEIIS